MWFCELWHVIVDTVMTLDPVSFFPSCVRGRKWCLSLDALEGKVSLHSISITINTRSFILNAFYFFFLFLKLHPVICRSEWRVNLNSDRERAINSDRPTQLVLLIYSLELGTEAKEIGRLRIQVHNDLHIFTWSLCSRCHGFLPWRCIKSISRDHSLQRVIL